MNEFIEYILFSNVINFAIIVAIFVFVFTKTGIGKKLVFVINEIPKQIENYVNTSIDEKENSLKKLNNVNEQIEHLPEEIQDINKRADNNIKSLEVKFQNEIEQKKKDIEVNGKRILNLETKKFQQKLTGIISEISVKLAKENAEKQLNDNRNLHNKYIDKAIDGIDGINLWEQ